MVRCVSERLIRGAALRVAKSDCCVGVVKEGAARGPSVARLCNVYIPMIFILAHIDVVDF